MRQTSILRVVLLGLCGALVSCGGSSGASGVGNSTLTQAQAQQVGTSLANDVSNALVSAIDNTAGPLDIGPRDHIRVALQRNRHANGAPTPESVSCSGSTCSLSGTYTCPEGGSIAVSGSFSGTSNSANGTITETPSNCSDGTLVINGDPDVTAAIQAGDNGIATTVSISVTGGVSFLPVQTGQFPTGTCTANLMASASVNDSSGSVSSISVSGSVCGQTID